MKNTKLVLYDLADSAYDVLEIKVGSKALEFLLLIRTNAVEMLLNFYRRKMLVTVNAALLGVAIRT